MLKDHRKTTKDEEFSPREKRKNITIGNTKKKKTHYSAHQDQEQSPRKGRRPGTNGRVAQIKFLFRNPEKREVGHMMKEGDWEEGIATRKSNMSREEWGNQPRKRTAFT